MKILSSFLIFALSSIQPKTSKAVAVENNLTIEAGDKDKLGLNSAIVKPDDKSIAQNEIEALLKMELFLKLSTASCKGF